MDNLEENKTIKLVMLSFSLSLYYEATKIFKFSTFIIKSYQSFRSCNEMAYFQNPSRTKVEKKKSHLEENVVSQQPDNEEYFKILTAVSYSQDLIKWLPFLKAL